MCTESDGQGWLSVSPAPLLQCPAWTWEGCPGRRVLAGTAPQLAHSPLDLPVTDACSWHPSLRGGADGAFGWRAHLPKALLGPGREGVAGVAAGREHRGHRREGKHSCVRSRGAGRGEDAAFLRCRWCDGSWSGQRPPRVTRSIFLSLGRICTPTVSKEFRKNDFSPR